MTYFFEEEIMRFNQFYVLCIKYFFMKTVQKEAIRISYKLSKK